MLFMDTAISIPTLTVVQVKEAHPIKQRVSLKRSALNGVLLHAEIEELYDSFPWTKSEGRW